jgi:hypothetical protein
MTTALEGGEGSASYLGYSLSPGKTRYPLYRRLGGSQGRSGQMRKNFAPPPGFDPLTVPVAIPTTLPGPRSWKIYRITSWRHSWAWIGKHPEHSCCFLYGGGTGNILIKLSWRPPELTPCTRTHRKEISRHSRSTKWLTKLRNETIQRCAVGVAC